MFEAAIVVEARRQAGAGPDREVVFELVDRAAGRIRPAEGPAAVPHARQHRFDAGDAMQELADRIELQPVARLRQPEHGFP